LFIRGESVAIIDRTSQDGSEIRIRDITPEAFRSFVERYGTLFAYRVGPHGETLLKPNACMSSDVAKMLLASRPARELLPSLLMVHRCPLLVEDHNAGTRLLNPGYHPWEGGRYIVADGALPSLPPLNQAATALLGLLDDFKFVAPSDKSRAMAALISPALRFGRLLVCHFPPVMPESDKHQAGKGTLVEIIQRIYGELPSMAIKRKGGVGSLDEDLGNKLLAGKPFVQIDNVREALDSQYFESLLTCPEGATVDARVPYKQAVQVDPNKHIFHLTSNRFEATEDFAARACVIRIIKRTGVKWKRFPEGNLIDHVAVNRWDYLAAVYAIVARWVAEGKPGTDDTRGEGRFRRWWQAVDWVVQEIFGLQPVLDDHQDIQKRMSTPVFSWLRNMGNHLKGDGWLDQELSASRLVEMANDAGCEAGLEIPGIRSDAPDDQKARKVGALLAPLFADGSSKIIIETFSITRVEREEYQPSRAANYTAKFYVFSSIV
jgi:hypothetical protein